MSKETLKNIPQFYTRYIDIVPEKKLDDALAASLEVWREVCARIPKDKEDFAYDQGKWTVKELLQHVIDTERIFTYRALCIARGERQDLPGYDENIYAENSNAKTRKLSDLIEEFDLQRRGGMAFFNSLDKALLERQGRANGMVFSAEAMGFLAVGHQLHHMKVLEERYL